MAPPTRVQLTYKLWSLGKKETYRSYRQQGPRSACKFVAWVGGHCLLTKYNRSVILYRQTEKTLITLRRVCACVCVCVCVRARACVCVSKGKRTYKTGKRKHILYIENWNKSAHSRNMSRVNVIRCLHIAMAIQISERSMNTWLDCALLFLLTRLKKTETAIFWFCFVLQFQWIPASEHFGIKCFEDVNVNTDVEIFFRKQI